MTSNIKVVDKYNNYCSVLCIVLMLMNFNTKSIIQNDLALHVALERNIK